ncbi:MAG: lamin tail domain-containing protein [Lactimicrobium sp.]|jgi:hypothetical protein|uniref:lamin tail domain-containing protein n=1 Tax=Lactimicrobium sp. TaxID=2563780 RepID=UPI002F3606D4
MKKAIVLAGCGMLAISLLPAHASGAIVINEVQPNDPDKGPDWVEIANISNTAVDLSGWYLSDDKGEERHTCSETTPIKDGTILNPGEVLVLEENTDFSFGLGKKGDSAILFDKDGKQEDAYSWDTTANGTWQRQKDGTFKDAPQTKGQPNETEQNTSALKINEVDSNPDDWVELINTGSTPIELDGFQLKDNSDDHIWRFTNHTIIEPRKLLLINNQTQGESWDKDGWKTDTFNIGLGGGDSIRLFDAKGNLLDAYSWTEHAQINGKTAGASYGRLPDGTGNFALTKETPGEANQAAPAETAQPTNTPEPKQTIAWPGPDTITTSSLTFLEDSSGLDFYNGKLYAVDNGTGKFWVMDVAKDGTLTIEPGFENGKAVNFTTPSKKGPDTEGITTAKDGYVYLASERDNSAKGTNYNVILKADPNGAENQNAIQQWDLTNLLPAVDANAGIEAVEWVDNSELKGKLFDQNTNAPYDPANYPNATADGVFFTALEANGHVYAFVLNTNGIAKLIADLDSTIGGAMGLDYDTYEHKLWIAADNGYNNISATMVFNGTDKPDITLVSPAKGIDINANNEGFAIASADYTVNGVRPVYHFQDGIKEGSLTIGGLYCDYKPEPTTEPTAQPTTEPTAVPSEKPTAVPTTQPSARPAADKAAKNTANSTQKANNAKTAAKTGIDTSLNGWLSIGILALTAAGFVLHMEFKEKQ